MAIDDEQTTAQPTEDDVLEETQEEILAPLTDEEDEEDAPIPLPLKALFFGVLGCVLLLIAALLVSLVALNSTGPVLKKGATHTALVLGEEAGTDDFAMTIQEAYVSHRVAPPDTSSDYQYFKAEGKNIVVVECKFTNTLGKAANLNDVATCGLYLTEAGQSEGSWHRARAYTALSSTFDDTHDVGNNGTVRVYFMTTIDANVTYEPDMKFSFLLNNSEFTYDFATTDVR